MKKLALYSSLLLLLLLSSCSKYGYVRLNYPLDPAVILPNDIQNIALIDRSKSSENDDSKKRLEAVVSAEIAGSDRKAAKECMRGVQEKLNGFHGMNFLIAEKLELIGTGTRVPAQLIEWTRVQELCDSLEVDAIMVLEVFDSNTDLVTGAVAGQVINVLNGGTPQATIPAQVRMNVYSMWRLYDPVAKTVIDQMSLDNNQSFNIASVASPTPPVDALPNAAYSLGLRYASRFLPSYYTVKRDMYKKGKGSSKNDMKVAFRKAEVANWKGAIERWEEIEKSGNFKSKGRAALNIAVAYEALGDTKQALEWAQLSYEEYGDKIARDYAKVLLRRQKIE